MAAFFSWLQHLSSGGPKRTRTGVWADRLKGTMFGIFSDIGSLSMDEAFLHRCMDEDDSPDDFLEFAAIERALPRYATETTAQHRARLLDAWNLWQLAGVEAGIVTQMEAAGFPSVTIITELPGGGDLDRGIPPYPDTDAHWSQFIVVINDENVTLGSGAVASPTAPDQTPSTIISQEYLDVARVIISKFKSVEWVCREIVVISGTGFYWGKPGVDWGDFEWGEASPTTESFPALTISAALAGY